ncbi:MAG: hypothetical protein ACPGWR_22225 [Ardenticatenaceae bacterium]
MSSLNIHSMLARCQRLLTDYATLLARHQYLEKQLASFQQKLLDSEPESHKKLEKQEVLLEPIEQRLKALGSDQWLDKLFSVAKNEQQVEEIERYMQRWGIGRPEQRFDNPAHCIVWHANKHGGGDILRYLRKASLFNKKGAKSKSVRGAKKWLRKSGEFLIERDGKIVSYGMN